MRKKGSFLVSISISILIMTLLVIAFLSLRPEGESISPGGLDDILEVPSIPTGTNSEAYPYPISTPPIVSPTVWVETRAPILPLPDIGKFSPPGPFKHMRIVYGRFDKPGYYSSDLTGLDETNIPATWAKEIPGGGGENHFLVAPDGSKLLVSSWNNKEVVSPLENSIWLCNPDGSLLELLVKGEGDGFPQDPIWSPDATHIAYRIVRYKDLSPYQVEIWVMQIQSKEAKLILSSPATGPGSYKIETWGGKAHFFRWMLNKYIYFVTQDERLIALNPDNKELFEFNVHQQPIELINSISPDGLHIADKLGSRASELSNAGFLYIEESEQVIEWSNDGKLYITKNVSSAGFTVVDTETGVGEYIDAATELYSASVSPDNRYVVYQGSNGLFILDLNTKKTEQIFQNSAKVEGNSSFDFLDWLPSN